MTSSEIAALAALLGRAPVPGEFLEILRPDDACPEAKPKKGWKDDLLSNTDAASMNVGVGK